MMDLHDARVTLVIYSTILAYPCTAMPTAPARRPRGESRARSWPLGSEARLSPARVRASPSTHPGAVQITDALLATCDARTGGWYTATRRDHAEPRRDLPPDGLGSEMATRREGTP
ncbi:unnamed protein product [Diplocarpon coronariae]